MAPAIQLMRPNEQAHRRWLTPDEGNSDASSDSPRVIIHCAKQAIITENKATWDPPYLRFCPKLLSAPTQAFVMLDISAWWLRNILWGQQTWMQDRGMQRERTTVWILPRGPGRAYYHHRTVRGRFLLQGESQNYSHPRLRDVWAHYGFPLAPCLLVVYSRVTVFFGGGTSAQFWITDINSGRFRNIINSVVSPKDLIL